MQNYPLPCRFENRQIQDIIEEAMLYMCACPAQVGTEILRLRELFAYQQACITKGETLQTVHHRIADAARAAHDRLEECLLDVLKTEGWDLQTLKMPPGLRELRQRALDED